MDGQVDKARETKRVRRRNKRRTDQGEEEEGELHGGVILVIKRVGHRPRERRDRDREKTRHRTSERNGGRETDTWWG